MPIRKRLIDPATPEASSAWLPIEDLARVEVTSEDPAHPIEAALTGDPRGWRASGPGEQLIRLLFDEPLAIRLVHLVFEHADQDRLQEFSLRCSLDGGRTRRVIVRQQFSFSPLGATREVEDYAVDLDGVTDLELHIVPDVSGRPVTAGAREFRLR